MPFCFFFFFPTALTLPHSPEYRPGLVLPALQSALLLVVALLLAETGFPSFADSGAHPGGMGGAHAIVVEAPAVSRRLEVSPPPAQATGAWLPVGRRVEPESAERAFINLNGPLERARLTAATQTPWSTWSDQGVVVGGVTQR